MVERAVNEIRCQVALYMNLARKAGRAALDASIGAQIGAVIVDRSNIHTPSVLVIAGDGRWKQLVNDKQHGEGNAMAHAVIRAIGMVARKRRACSDLQQDQQSDHLSQAAFADTPLTPIEHEVYSISTIAPRGYLCLDLELYITHEPCVMCSMALLHSRFGRVVFGTSMMRTGGLMAEREKGGETQGLSYGLFWRPSLNWKFLAWQWIDSEDSRLTSADDPLHA